MLRGVAGRAGRSPDVRPRSAGSRASSRWRRAVHGHPRRPPARRLDRPARAAPRHRAHQRRGVRQGVGHPARRAADPQRDQPIRPRPRGGAPHRAAPPRTLVSAPPSSSGSSRAGSSWPSTPMCSRLSGHSPIMEAELPEGMQVTQVAGEGLIDWTVSADRRLHLIWQRRESRPAQARPHPRLDPARRGSAQDRAAPAPGPDALGRLAGRRGGSGDADGLLRHRGGTSTGAPGSRRPRRPSPEPSAGAGVAARRRPANGSAAPAGPDCPTRWTTRPGSASSPGTPGRPGSP